MLDCRSVTGVITPIYILYIYISISGPIPILITGRGPLEGKGSHGHKVEDLELEIMHG